MSFRITALNCTYSSFSSVSSLIWKHSLRKYIFDAAYCEWIITCQTPESMGLGLALRFHSTHALRLYSLPLWGSVSTWYMETIILFLLLFSHSVTLLLSKRFNMKAWHLSPHLWGYIYNNPVVFHGTVSKGELQSLKALSYFKLTCSSPLQLRSSTERIMKKQRTSLPQLWILQNTYVLQKSTNKSVM